MKTLLRSTLLICSFLLLGAPSIYFDILIPSYIDLPAHIKSVALIDRSESENGLRNVLEKGLISAISGKGDRHSASCLEGLATQIESYGMVKIVPTQIVEKRPGNAMDFPEPMRPFEIDKICEDFNVDAVIALEIFSKQVFDDVSEVKVGFRIYDHTEKQITDEYQFYHGVSSNNRSPSESSEGIDFHLLNNESGMKRASVLAGIIYGKRISPHWLKVERFYYKRSKGDPKMKEGARMMEVNNWDAAIHALSQVMEHGHRKSRGRAAHNLAVVYEVTGQVELALETAQLAWGAYGNKKARAYSPILQARVNEVNMLKSMEKR